MVTSSVTLLHRKFFNIYDQNAWEVNLSAEYAFRYWSSGEHQHLEGFHPQTGRSVSSVDFLGITERLCIYY